MNIIAKKGKVLEEKADLLVLGVFAGVQDLTGLPKEADKKLGGYLTVAMAEESFGGKLGDQLVLHSHGKLPAGRVMVVGLGDKKQFGVEALRRALGTAVKFAEKIEATTIVCPALASDVLSVKAMVEGALLADYAYLAYKPAAAKRAAKRGLVTMAILTEETAALRSLEKGIALGEIFARATVYSRDLVNEPAGQMTPRHLLDHAQKIAANDREIKLKVLDRDACAKLGMHAYLAVAKGSDEPPYFLHLTYAPAAAKRKIVLIGKGVTFDSGGLSLKPGNAMETMKCDMAGAAAVLGVFSVLSDLGSDYEVHGLIPACENMPSGKAMRPGDIVTAMNGKTIEVLNTDAEGRLTLGDAISYAVKKIAPHTIIDLATLTGACMVALGEDIAALMANDEKLSTRLLAAAKTSGEALWPLPLHGDYGSLVSGDHSDLRNTSRGRYGGAITAGLFLQEFVGATSWAHLDIAGPAFAEKEMNSYTAKGGTGYGVRMLLNLLKN